MKTISLTQGKEALVDDSDYEELSKHKWYAMRCRYGVDRWYAARKAPVSIDPSRKIQLMHRVIFAAQLPTMLDHIDGNGLNNQRANIRTSSPSLNQHNKAKPLNQTSKYKGVHKHGIQWRARCAKGLTRWSGYYKTEAEAAEAYNKKAIELYGDYASLNVMTHLPYALNLTSP